MAFQRASIQQSYLRMALLGPSGSGKTYTALNIGTRLGQRAAVIDTEHRSACKYADQFTFDTAILESFSPQLYIETMRDAGKAGYDVLIIDSLSHAWCGKDGLLEFVDNASRRNQGNSFNGWRDATPLHNQLVEAILSYPGHVIATMRVKMEHVQDKDPRTGKTTIRKVGLQPVQRDGMEYEFDVLCDIDMEHNLVVSKTRCFALTDKVFHKAGRDVAEILLPWLNGGAPRTEPTPPIQPATPAMATAPAPAAASAAPPAAEPIKPKKSKVLTPEQQAMAQEVTQLSMAITDASGARHFDSAKWKAFLAQAMGADSLPLIDPARYQELRDRLLELQDELHQPAPADAPPVDDLADVPDPFAGDATPEDPETAAPADSVDGRAQIATIMQLADQAGLLTEDGQYSADMFRLIAGTGLPRKKLADFNVIERQIIIAALETKVGTMAGAAAGGAA